MNDINDARFSRVLHMLSITTYEPNSGEKALIYDVMSDAFNPLGLYYSICAASLSWRFARAAASMRQRQVVTLLSALYGYETSWLLHEPFPTQRFMTDATNTEGRLRAYVLDSYNALLYGCVTQSTPMQQLIQLLTLRKTREHFFHDGKYSEKERWLALSHLSWFPFREMDILTYLYWRLKLFNYYLLPLP